MIGRLTVCVCCRRRNLALCGYSFHGSHGRKRKDDRQRLDKALEKTYHDLELTQGRVVAVEACQEENLFSRNDVLGVGKSTDLDVVGPVGKFRPFSGMKNKSVGVLFRHATGQRLARLRGDDLVPNRFSFLAQLVVHFLLVLFVTIAIDVVILDAFLRIFAILRCWSTMERNWCGFGLLAGSSG